MRPSPQKLANLSDALPYPALLPVDNAVLAETPPAIQDLISMLPLQAYTLSCQATYQELIRLFQSHPDAVGVLIVEETGGACLGMVSRQRVLEWRSHRLLWRKALKQSLPQQPHWWQLAQEY